MKHYEVSNVADYVAYRFKYFERSMDDNVLKLTFKTPLTLKYHGEFLNDFNMDAIIAAIKRRVYMLNCFEGADIEMNELYEGHIPIIVEEMHRRTSVPRYSNRKHEKMRLWGIKGECVVQNITEECLKLLIAGELLHIGKNTSFGYGRYHIHKVETTQQGS